MNDSEYIELFESKQNLIFSGYAQETIASFGDNFFFNMSDIKFDIDTNQPKRIFLDWFDYALDAHTTGARVKTYQTYCKERKMFLNEDKKPIA